MCDMFIQAKGTDFEKVLHWNHFDVFNTKTDVDLVKILGFSANPSDNNYWKSSKSYDVIDFSRLLELMRDQFIREIPYSYSPISITQCFRSPKEVELLIPIGFSSDENVIVAITRPNNWPPIDNHHNESGTRLITIDLTTRKVNTLFDGRKTWDEIYLPVSSQNKNTVSGFVLETLSGADGKWKRMYSLKIWDITSGQEIDAIHQVCYDRRLLLATSDDAASMIVEGVELLDNKQELNGFTLVDVKTRQAKILTKDQLVDGNKFLIGGTRGQIIFFDTSVMGLIPQWKHIMANGRFEQGGMKRENHRFGRFTMDRKIFVSSDIYTSLFTVQPWYERQIPVTRKAIKYFTISGDAHLIFFSVIGEDRQSDDYFLYNVETREKFRLDRSLLPEDADDFAICGVINLDKTKLAIGTRRGYLIVCDISHAFSRTVSSIEDHDYIEIIDFFSSCKEYCQNRRTHLELLRIHYS